MRPAYVLGTWSITENVKGEERSHDETNRDVRNWNFYFGIGYGRMLGFGAEYPALARHDSRAFDSGNDLDGSGLECRVPIILLRN